MSRNGSARRARLALPKIFLLAGLMCVLAAARAQTIPGSGELLQQTPRPATPAPPAGTGLRVEEPSAQRLESSASFFVRQIVISGNTLLSTPELHDLVAQAEAKALNLTLLEQLAAVITHHYQEKGYLLSRAYIPPQTLSDGTVRIAILEARYGAVTLSNTSSASDALIQSYLASLEPGQPVIEGPLERSLLLASDIPGAILNSTLAPGAAPGTSDLKIAAIPGARLSGDASLDDGGNRYTGDVRGSGTLNLNEPFHQGDVLSLSGMTAGSNLSYGRLGYQALIDDGGGTSIGGAVSGLYYRLGGGSTADLHAHGIAEVESLNLLQPLIRTTGGNLSMQASITRRQLRDEIDATEIHTDRDTDSFGLTVAGDHRDFSGIVNFSATATAGHVIFVNTAAESVDAAAAHIAGTYAKFAISVARLQTLDRADSLYIAVNGQLADKNLDSSEQFFLGGPNSVRAYSVGAVGGAQGALGTLEFRRDLGVSWGGTWQAVAFVDTGTVQIYKAPPGPLDNHATLSGAGAGLNWIARPGWTASVSAATPIGGRSNLAGDASSTRVWFEIHKAFNLIR